MSLQTAILLFLIFTIVIAISGTYLSKAADQLADLTGWGEALLGAILVGGVTSLSGIVTSVTSAWEGYPQLSVSNAIGGIAAQTFFLAVADIFYKKANLEHASASIPNLMQAVLLMIMLALLLLVNAMHNFHFFGIHPASILMLVIYVAGQKLASKANDSPMWRPVKTKDTMIDIPNEEYLKHLSLRKVALKFAALSICIATAGYIVAQSAIVISDQSGLSQSVVGAIFTSISTSLPELIVSVSAVRQGALTLAVSNVIGGNSFDILFVAFSDFAYRDGSIIHTFTISQNFIISLTLLLTGILTLGMLYRERKGIFKFGWESFLIIIIFLAGYIALPFL